MLTTESFFNLSLPIIPFLKSSRIRYLNNEGRWAGLLRNNIFPLPTAPTKPAYFTRKG
jgi:hypothetical protein